MQGCSARCMIPSRSQNLKQCTFWIVCLQTRFVRSSICRQRLAARYWQTLSHTKSQSRQAGQWIAWAAAIQLLPERVEENRCVHICIAIPGHWIQINSGALVIDPARAKLLEQPDHAWSSRLIWLSEYPNIKVHSCRHWTMRWGEQFQNPFMQQKTGTCQWNVHRNLEAQHKPDALVCKEVPISRGLIDMWCSFCWNCEHDSGH